MKSKHRMARFPGGWNYRGYCVYRKCRGQAGCLWQAPGEEGGEWEFFYRTLAEFRREIDKLYRQGRG